MRPTVTARAYQLAQAALLLLLLLLVDCASARAGWAIGVGGPRNGEAVATAAPAAPTGVAAACTSTNGNTIKVTWSAVTHATTYTIWQSTTSASSGFSVVATGVTGTSWTSGTLANGKYWFEVSALIGANWTSPTSSATAKRTITTNNCT